MPDILDATSCSILLCIIIQSVLLAVSFIYYVKVIRPNIDKLFWKIRRPNYFVFYIVVTLLNDIIRCTARLLLHMRIINPYLNSLVSIPLMYFGGITWGSIRLWLLYYDIKIARNAQLFLLSKLLLTNSDSSISFTPSKDEKSSSYIYMQQKQYKSVTIKVFTAVTIFCAITLLLHFVFDPVIALLLQYSFMLILLLFYTYFLFTLICCKCRSNGATLATSPFRDDWLLLLELTIIWVVWMIGIFGAFAFLPFRDKPIYNILIVFLLMITRIMITVTMLILPYLLSLKLSKRSNKTMPKSVLKNILSTKAYFYSFVDHLVQELAIENLTVLVEIWQFKYEQKYNLKPLQISEKIHLEIEKTKEKDISTTNPQQLNAGSFSAYNNEQDVHKMIDFLQSLPWRKLPLARSVASNLSQTRSETEDNTMDVNNKWQQCVMIFGKYFDEQSYDAVNVSYSTRYQIHNSYYTLLLYEQDKNGTREATDGNMIIQSSIENDEEFNEKLLKVFDVAIGDIFHNLQDSLTRFVESEEFKLIQ